MLSQEHAVRRFTSRGVAYGALGVSSLLLFGLSIAIGSYQKGLYLGLGLLLCSAGAGVIALFLNFQWLRRIADGAVGESDLVCTWAGLFSAFFTCLFCVLLLRLIAA